MNQLPEQPDDRQRQFDFGWRGALEGMQRAVDHAEDEAPGWGHRALAMLRAYVDAHPDQPLISPDVRRWAAAQGLDEPPNKRAWGAVFLRASRAGLIEQAGFQKYGDEDMHTQAIVVWRARR